MLDDAVKSGHLALPEPQAQAISHSSRDPEVEECLCEFNLLGRHVRIRVNRGGTASNSIPARSADTMIALWFTSIPVNPNPSSASARMAMLAEPLSTILYGRRA